MPSADPDTATDVLLPEDLRLPDLSGIRTVTFHDLYAWLALADRAAAWGPDQRNGCIRRPPSTWVNADGHAHSPDPWTPAEARVDSAHWSRHGLRHRPGDQPSRITTINVYWTDREGRLHRAHAPAALSTTSAPDWWWHGRRAADAHADLLNAAWPDQPLTDPQARTILNQAEHLTPEPGEGIDPHTWVAHILTARPEAPTWPAATRTWLHLLTT